MNKHNKNIKSLIIYLPALLAMLFFGMSYIWTKVLLNYYGPITIIFIRLLISVILLSLFSITRKKVKIEATDYKYFLILALFEPFLYFLGENFGIQYVSPTIASLMISTIPVVTPIFSYLFLKEKISINNLIGLILSFGGVVIVLTAKNSSLNYSLKGIFLLLLAVLAAVGYSIIAKNLTKKYSSVKIVQVQNAIGLFYFLPLFIIFEGGALFQKALNLEIINAFFQLAVFASTLAFVFITTSIRNLGVNKTNVFINLIPITTAFFAFLFYGKVFNGQEIIGIVVVIIGLFLAQKKRRQDIILHED